TTQVFHYDPEFTDWVNEDRYNVYDLSEIHIPGIAQYPIIGDVVQRYYTEDDLEVVGLAAYIWNGGTWWLNMIHYLLLYEAEPDTFQLVGMLPWQYMDSNYTVRAPITTRHTNSQDCSVAAGDYYTHADLVEKYFETPIVVKDSFYVGGTQRGNLPSIMGETYLYDAFDYHMFHTYSDLVVWGHSDSNCVRPPSHWKIMNMNPRELSYHPEFGYNEWVNYETQQYLLVLPIVRRIDTTYYAPECEKPTNLHLAGTSGDSTTLAWNGNGQGEWELSYGLLGQTLDECTIVGCSDSSWTYVDTLHDGMEMQACVRTVCRYDDSVYYSEWTYLVSWTNSSEPVEIHLPDEGELGAMVRMMPNPAQGKVTVLSSYRISRVEAYSLTGQQYLRQQPQSISTSFDVSAWPQGVYLVTISTEGGSLTRKLVKE
ncbi:MAG: T9SS type A sorting domain-containing protein, partial [Bacteroidales bacterium]|nr:T9SS type A sorting domain-containing protein [Bacteroidales bacterium]